MVSIIGWLSSGILMATLIVQIAKQWRERTSKGVSKWLFAGQILSEIGFLTYSWLLSNWVFAATNAALVIVNFVGLLMTLHFRKGKATK